MRIRLLLCTLTIGWVSPTLAVPVVPNFTQGSMTSVTTQTVTTNETINSMDYATGWTYSVSGSGVKPEGDYISPDVTTTQTNTVDGVNSTWTGLDLSTQNKPNWVQSEPGNAFQFTEHYSGPGLQTHTIIQRAVSYTHLTLPTTVFV